MSDGWAAYAHIPHKPGKNYKHSVIIHKRHFVDPNNREIHTQNIECLWSRMKLKIKRMFGSEEEKIETYFHEFQWREMVKGYPGKCIFPKFIYTLTQRYIFI